ncbi:nucleolar protein 6 [Plodia interpunctella]|uniref:nucleolar protein 6 n=1 Tax=Plodia interpunctella TaxID=58824 RepID=UPI0023679C9A|nr:nucleolar protein 6 [Plodia interpunctella]
MAIVKKLNMSVSEETTADVVNENGKRSATDRNTEGKKRIRGLYRQPTVNELNRLRETENLFNSNLFRLQVDEVLQEVKVKEKTEKKFQQWFLTFKTYLLSIPPDDNEYDLTEQTVIKKLKVKLPISNKIMKTKCVFKFHKFNSIEIVGSYNLGCPINSKLRVDIQITVPADTYTKNDSINYRYHKKRAAYLAFIASHLKNLETIEDLQYSFINGSDTKAVIDLKPSGKLGNFVSVRIDLSCEQDAYKLHRFSPTRNNLREAWLFSSDGNESIDIGPATPYYNSSVLSDLTSSINEQYLKEVLSRSENLKQAVVLLKIWIRQRKLVVSGHVVSMLVAYLVQIKRINNIMSSYQIVRNVWIAIKSSEWDKKGISLHKEGDSPAIEEFHQYFPVVFLDKTGYHNLLWQMCRGTYDALKRESELAVEMLDNGNINSFIPLFMTPVQPLTQFDHILKFKDLNRLKQSVLSKVPKETQLNYGLDELALVTETLHCLMSKGLGNRVDLILQQVDANFSWPVKKTPEKAKKEGYEENLSFGLVLNPEHCVNVVEKGPPANLPEAEEFRSFWGEKSELRRFQDGSITETCVWDGETTQERRGITKQIVNYLMKTKYDIPQSDVFHICDQLDTLTSRKQYSDAQTEQCSLEALRAFDELRRDLRQLTQLPLDVSAVYGVSPVFSYSDPLPPLPRAAPRNPWRRGSASLVKEITREGNAVAPEYTPVSKAIIELGHSGKWPGDIEAFRCLKAAFNLQIAERLQKQYSLPTQAYPTHIDVLKNGLVFRLEIAHPKEITLLRREIENGVVKFRETEDSIKLQCETVLMPRLRGALHGLHQKHPSFGPTVCLFKRWLSSHLLSPPHVPPAVAELLVASVFVHSAPLAPPTMPTAGLVRVLTLLANTDWTREMIVLDFNEDMKREEITELERQFSSREDPTPTIHIVTAYDAAHPAIWSRRDPTPQVIARAKILADSTLRYFQRTLLIEMKDNILSCFVPSLSGYDVLIRLNPALVPYTSERVERPALSRKLPTTFPEDIIPVVDFDPVRCYLEELRHAYSEFALFFHDSYGGDVIAVLWKPDIDEPREFQVLNANALTPVTVKGDTKYKINKQALIEDFRILGEGLVRDVTFDV